MAYALKGSSAQTVFQSKSSADSKKPAPFTRVIVRSHLSPAQTAREIRGSVGKLAGSISAATLLLVSPAFAAQAPSLFEGNTTYQQELQDLIRERGSLPDLPSPPDPSKAASNVKKAAQSSEFKLPDVAKGSVDTPKELADKALPEALKSLPPPPTPTPSSSTPGQPKAEGPKVEAPKLPKLEAPKLEAPKAPKVEAPKPPSLPTPSTPQAPPLPQQQGGGLPTPYLAAGGAALLAIIGIGLAGAKPDQAPSPPASSSGSSAPKSSGGSSGSMPEGKDPELDSEVAKKKDPFFKEVDKRT